VLALFRRARIDETTLDHQLDAIESESHDLRASIEKAQQESSTPAAADQLQTARCFLRSLREQFMQELPIAPQSSLVELLVDSICVEVLEPLGVRRSEVVVRYRFSSPGHARPLIWEQRHSADRRYASRAELNTLGDHLRRRRLALHLSQHQVAEQLAVTRTSIHNWEHNRQRPKVAYVPAILNFLGYCPELANGNWADRLVQARACQGLTRGQAADRMGINPSTLARWERGERKPHGECAQRAHAFVEAAVRES
jgi:transcriptional regulator with XRE-family HTH domain